MGVAKDKMCAHLGRDSSDVVNEGAAADERLVGGAGDARHAVHAGSPGRQRASAGGELLGQHGGQVDVLCRS